jgi:hypothetical protein
MGVAVVTVSSHDLGHSGTSRRLRASSTPSQHRLAVSSNAAAPFISAQLAAATNSTAATDARNADAPINCVHWIVRTRQPH